MTASSLPIIFGAEIHVRVIIKKIIEKCILQKKVWKVFNINGANFGGIKYVAVPKRQRMC